MTEIPEHLRKRAEARRAGEQPAPSHWEMSPQVAKVIISISRKLLRKDVDPLTRDELDCIAIAKAIGDDAATRRREALRRLIAEYEAEYGVITEEEMASIWEEPN